MSQSGRAHPRDQREEILRLCQAVREAMGDLSLDPTSASELSVHLSAAEAAVGIDTADLNPVRAIRHVLLESADGPLVPFLADAAARIIGDGFGKLFYR